MIEEMGFDKVEEEGDYVHDKENPKQSLAASKDHVFYSWHDIKFKVPVVKNERKRLAEEAENEPKFSEEVVDHRVKLLANHSSMMSSRQSSQTWQMSQASGMTSGRFPDSMENSKDNMPNAKNFKRKTILFGLSGFAKPGQIMCIMGGSGSGKTSLLNVLGQRLGLSPGSKMTGSVKCNNIPLKKNDFGKFGAFV